MRLWCALALALCSAPAAARGTFYLQPLGSEIADQEVSLVSQAVTAMYGVAVKTLPRVELPRAAWYPPRSRYRAEKLLAFLAPRLPEDGVRILGITAVDISTTKGKYEDWGLLGLGSMDGTSGVISLFRCKKGAASLAHARIRLQKVAVHEFGHTLGLEHCPNTGCLMRDAEGSVSSTDHEFDLCMECRQKLRAAGRAIPEHPFLPWPPAP